MRERNRNPSHKDRDHKKENALFVLTQKTSCTIVQPRLAICGPKHPAPQKRKTDETFSIKTAPPRPNPFEEETNVDTASTVKQDAVDYRTEPSRYKHWSLAVDGEVATLTLNIDEG